MGEGTRVETIRGGCPICGSDVKGNDKYLYFCSKCTILYNREHLQLSTARIEGKVKESIIHTYGHRKGELQHGIMKRQVRESKEAKLRPIEPARHEDMIIPRRLKMLPVPDSTSNSRAEPAPSSAAELPMEVVNIFVQTSLGCEIPLKKVSVMVEGTEYNTKKSPGVMIKFDSPKTTIILFESGTALCLGARKMAHAREAFGTVESRLRKIGIPCRLNDLEVRNITCSGNVGRELNLDKMAMKLENTEYEPQQFPGLVFKTFSPDVTFILFENGKVVSAGAKSAQDIIDSHKALMHALREH